MSTGPTQQTKEIHEYTQKEGQQIYKQNEKSQKQEQINDTVRVEVDSTWIGVLILTNSLMQGSDNLYYLHKQQVKLVDVNKMNDLIKFYPTILNKISTIGKYSFNPDISQTQQTKEFLIAIGINPSQLQGICFQREQAQCYNPIEDQIDLDL